MEAKNPEIIFYYKSLPYQTQAQRTYDMLLEMIALDELSEKSIFTELELTQMLQIGRTPLRDALRLLEFDSIIETIPRLGIRIREVRVEEYFLQSEVRTTVELMVIQRACTLADNDQRERLAKLNDNFAKIAALDDRLTLYRIDRSIHTFIDECCKNPYAVHALAPLRFYEQRIHYLLGRIYPGTDEILNREHIQYVSDIVAGDVDSAALHFQNMMEATLKLVKLRVDAHMGLPFSMR